MLQGGVSGQDGVVELHHGRRHLVGGVDGGIGEQGEVNPGVGHRVHLGLGDGGKNLTNHPV